METTTEKHKIYPVDFVAVYINKLLKEGKNRFTSGELAGCLPKLKENQTFELVGFDYANMAQGHTSGGIDQILCSMLKGGYAVKYDDHSITKIGEEYIGKELKKFVSENPRTAQLLCLSLGTDINYLLPFAPMEARVQAFDPVSGKCRIETKYDRQFSISITGKEIQVYHEDKIIGKIMPGCKWAGAVFYNRALIGEYERFGHIYQINPVCSGGLTFEFVQQHPIDYLIEEILLGEVEL